MKPIRPIVFRLVALATFSCGAAWLIHDRVSEDMPKLAELAPEVTDPQEAKITAILAEHRETINEWLSERRSVPEDIRRSREFDDGTLPKRIPAGATDPDRLWRDQMQNARATMRQAIPPSSL